MAEDIDKKLAELEFQIQRRKKIEEMVPALELELSRLEELGKRLARNLQSEKREYEDSTKKSVSNLFRHLKDTLKDTTEEELKDVLNAKLNYDQNQADISDVKAKIENLSEERLLYANSQLQYNELYNQKLSELKKVNSETAVEIMKLTNLINYSKSNLMELDEAIVIGEELFAKLETAHRKLNGSLFIGFVESSIDDNLNGFFSQPGIDEASDLIVELLPLLRQYSIELTDILDSDQIVYSLESLGETNTGFIQGVVNDMYTGGRYNFSEKSVYTLKTQVSVMLEILYQLESEEIEECKQLEKKLEELLDSDVKEKSHV